jgi:hypothetical protein
MNVLHIHMNYLQNLNELLTKFKQTTHKLLKNFYKNLSNLSTYDDHPYDRGPYHESDHNVSHLLI